MEPDIRPDMPPQIAQALNIEYQAEQHGHGQSNIAALESLREHISLFEASVANNEERQPSLSEKKPAPLARA